MRVIFMGTPEFAVPALKALVRASHSPLEGESKSANKMQRDSVGGNKILIITPHDSSVAGSLSSAPPQGGSDIEIIAVYSQPPRSKGRGLHLTPSPIHKLAEGHGIPVFTPVSLKSPEEQEKFRTLNADVAVVVAYGLLLPQAILDAPKHGCINIHPSALPRWRGAAPIQRTIMAGDDSTDICIMQMDAGLDTGDVILRKSYDIPEGTTAGMLHDQLAQEAPALLLQALMKITDGTATRTKQSDVGVTYAQKISKEEAKLDFNQPAEVVRQKILGLSPFPGAWFEHEGERIKIFNASLRESNALPLACNPGILYPTELQREGGRRMGVEEFLAGFKLDD